MGPDGDYFGRIELYRDVTGLRMMEQRKDDFFASAESEIRGPLSIIKGYGSLLQKELAALEDVAHDLELRTGFDVEAVGQQVMNLDTEVDELLNVVNRFQDIMRLESHTLVLRSQAVDLRRLTTGLINRIQHRFPTHPFRVDVTDEDLTALGDVRRLRHVLYILIRNAARYSSPIAPITVSVQRSASAGQPVARLTVEDRGMGLEPGEADRVFQRFYRGERAQRLGPRGLGISLYLAEAIVQHHGGRMWAESDGPGRGSRFVAEVPLLV